MQRQEIVMNFGVPPSNDDLLAIANDVLASLPDELVAHIEQDLALEIEEFANDTLLQDLNVESPYELLAYYKSAKQLTPGVTKKVANDDDALVLFRRAILDYWCETGDDLGELVRQIMIEEIARNFEYPDDIIDEMTARAHQG